MKYSFTFPFRPQPWSAPRVCRNGHVYSKNGPFIAKVREILLAKGPLHKLTGPLHLKVKFFFAPPVSWSKVKKNNHLGRAHIVKPDCSNLVKLVEDAIKSVLFTDDAQIAKISAQKVYDLESRIEIEVTEIENPIIWKHTGRLRYTQRHNNVWR